MCRLLLSHGCGDTAAAAAGPCRIDAAWRRKAREEEPTAGVATTFTPAMTASLYADVRSAWAMALVVVIVIGAAEPTTWLPSVRASGLVLSASTTVGKLGAGWQMGSSVLGGRRPGWN